MAYKFNPLTGNLDEYGPILTGTGTVSAAADGTAALPGIAFTNDLNTGIYRPGADQLALSTNGVQRINIEADGDINIDSGGVFYDATNNRLAIGTTSPTTPLAIQFDSSNAWTSGELISGTTNNTLNGLRIYNASNSANAEASLFLTAGDANTSQHSIASVKTGSNAGDLVFRRRNGVGGSAESLRIDSSGRLLVGTSSTSAGSTFVLQGNTASSGIGIISLANTGSSPVNGEALGVIRFTSNTHNAAAAILAARDAGTWTSGSSEPTRLTFFTTSDASASPTERMRITNDGRVLLGATTGDSGLVVDRAVSRAALGTTAPGRIYTGAGTITDNTTVASGTVSHGTIVSFDNPAIAATNASVTYTRASTLYVDGAPTAGTNVTISNRYGLFVNAGNTVLGENVTIGGAVIPASATASLTLVNGTIPSASVVNGVSLYAEDVSSSSELKVRDEAGNITTLSPHNFSLIPEGPSEEMAWAFYSERDGTKINVDMLKAIRLLEQLTGEQLVYLSEAQ